MKLTHLTLAISLALLAGSFASAQSLPTGFSDESVVTGLAHPVGLDFTNDGRFFVVERISAKVFACDTAGNKTLCGFVPDTDPTGDGGLVGVAIDPDWPVRPYIYVVYAVTGNVRVSRFTIDGDLNDPSSTNLSLGDLHHIFVALPSLSPFHNGGSLRFGPDGMLYLSLGDDMDGPSAQVISTGTGQILRMDLTQLPAGPGGPPDIASITPVDNPFLGSVGFGPLTWAYGLRNPFRFHIDQLTGNLYVADVGTIFWEELNEITTAGENLGWPDFEANAPSLTTPIAMPPFTAPIGAIEHSMGWLSMLTFGGRYRNPSGGAANFGVDYEGDVFVQDYVTGKIRRFKTDGTSWQTPPPVPGQTDPVEWATGYFQVTDAIVGPDGAIYYAKMKSNGSIRRIKKDPVLTSLELVSGDDQFGVAGRPLDEALTVRATDAQGLPLAGQPIQFAIEVGAGVLATPLAVTDAAGLASTVFTPGTTDSTDPVISATAPGSDPVFFHALWRGLVMSYVPGVDVGFVNVKSAFPNAIVALAWDAPVAVPYNLTQFGPLWTSLANPGPDFGILANNLTGSDRVWHAILPGLSATIGSEARFQALGLDLPVLLETDYFFISNPVTLNFASAAAIPTIEVASGHNQVGTAGQALAEELVARVLSADGSPLAGVPVDFATTADGGALSSRRVLTDADGLARVSWTLSRTGNSPARVTASLLDLSPPAVFEAIWRGLRINYDRDSGIVTTEITMANPGIITVIAFDLPSPIPYLTTPLGEIWVDVLNPGPSFGVSVGSTGPDATWTHQLLAPGIPSLTYQGFGNGFPTAAIPEGVLVSPPFTIRF